eukprot:6197519-Pleurochrysis_carterae.AAC.2
MRFAMRFAARYHSNLNSSRSAASKRKMPDGRLARRAICACVWTIMIAAATCHSHQVASLVLSTENEPTPPVEVVAETPPTTEASTASEYNVSHLGACPSKPQDGAAISGIDLCEKACEFDGECADGEKCCTLGCSRTCQMAVIPALQFNLQGIVFVGMLVCGWAIACGTSGQRAAT